MTAAICSTNPATVVDQQINAMTGNIAVPRENGELVFDAPWQSRAFGIAVSLSKAGLYPWDKFRAELARAIAEKGQLGLDEYYLRWLDALECCLADCQMLDERQLHERESEFKSGARDEVF